VNNMLLNRDIFFMSLTKSVSDWYDEHYFADRGELENKKAQEAIVNLPPTVKSVINAN